MKADQPMAKGGSEQYHLHTQSGDLSALCLIVGAPGRAEMIGERFLTDARRIENKHRGFVSVTGEYQEVRVSVTTSGMGGSSIGIVLPEAVRSGARIFIRVGSCGSLIQQSEPGDPIIVTAAARYDGASECWVPMQYPAFADWRVVAALNRAAKRSGQRYFMGVEATTACFNEGQARPNLFGEVSPEDEARHQMLLRLRVACYSMEAASLFVWCATSGGGLPAGAINAIFANRITNAWETVGEELASEIALNALVDLARDPSLRGFLNRSQPCYPLT